MVELCYATVNPVQSMELIVNPLLPKNGDVKKI